MAPSPTVNDIRYTDHALAMADQYLEAGFAASYNAQYWNGIDGYQRFVQLAAIREGESVLDFACGTGLAGLLACEVLGGPAPDVYFADMSLPMLRQAKSEVQRRHPQVPNSHFQRVVDLRDAETCQMLLQRAGKPAGFDVVLAKLILSHFTEASQHRFIAHLRTLLAPGGRLVIDYGPLSPSRAYAGGSQTDEIVVGMRRVRLTQDWGRVRDWRMGYQLQVQDFTTMVTTGDRNRARQSLRDIIARGGGVAGAWQEAYDRSGTANISEELIARAGQHRDPANENPSVQLDMERRREVDRMLEHQGESVVFAPGRVVTFRMMFNIAMVVQ